VKKIAVIHFHPLELYPPVMNFIRFFEDGAMQGNMVVYTMYPQKTMPLFASGKVTVRIRRYANAAESKTAWQKLWRYTNFYIGVLFHLLLTRPSKLLYFETISSFPAIVYKRIFPSTGLFAHYHEYTSPEEMGSDGMLLTRWFYKLERRLYPKMDWVSHTNALRMQNFIADIAPVEIAHPHILPNYPPRSWYVQRDGDIRRPVRIVYVGALGLGSMYVKEFAEWVIGRKGEVTWDIYTLNVSEEAKEYLASLGTELIQLKGACDYYWLPQVLKNYDVGVVLYKGIIPNHVIAVSNKVFEYLACGLDVWYSKNMIGTDPYVSKGVFPKVLSVDFSALSQFRLEDALSRVDTSFQASQYYSEKALSPLFEALAHRS
jgi:hypothetical protein